MSRYKIPFLFFLAIECIIFFAFVKRIVSIKDKTASKYLSKLLLLIDWIRLNQKGLNLYEHLAKLGYKNIALCGSDGFIALVRKEVVKAGINVQYIINLDDTFEFFDTDIYGIKDQLPQTEAVLVTDIDKYERIRDVLQDKIYCPVISLEDIIREMHR